MPALSSNALFHFTNSKRNLISILERTFIPHFCLEDRRDFVKFSPRHEEALSEHLFCAIPIISFCDIPLSQTSKHMDTYGEYAIGLTKEWGIRKGISPVLYMHHMSSVSRGIFDAMLINLENEKDDRILDGYLTSIFTLCKPYEGKLFRKTIVGKTVRFYDEREWRYVAAEENGAVLHLNESDYYKKKEKGELAYYITRLNFEPRDIKYIILKKESEIPVMIEKIRDIKEKYDYKETDLLITRIVSAEQIRTDF